MRRSGVSRTWRSAPTIIATLGPYTSASISPTRHPAAAIASARLTATVDLPTPPLPLATATTWRTPGTSRRLDPGAIRGVAGACSIRTSTAGTPGMAATVRRTSSTICAATSGLVLGALSDTVTPLCAISISLTMPKETISRVKPGYLTLLSWTRISLGVGIDEPLLSKRELGAPPRGANRCYHSGGRGKTRAESAHGEQDGHVGR